MIQSIDVELTRPGVRPVIYASAGDMYSRQVEMHLYASGVPYTPPEGTTCLIGWERVSGAPSNVPEDRYNTYSRIMDADKTVRPAYTLDGNTLTIELEWRMCEVPGDVEVTAVLAGPGDSRLHAWLMLCRVEKSVVTAQRGLALPSESASVAAERAAQAAEDAAEARASAAPAAANAADAAADLAEAASRAEAAANRAEAAAPVEGAVISVNGKGGVVVLDAYDVGAVPAPEAAGIQPGMLLAVKEVTAGGKIVTEAVDPPSDEGFVEMEQDAVIPVEQRRKGTLYGLITHRLSDEPEAATYAN